MVHHREYLVAEGDESDGSDNSSGDEDSHPARRTIRVCDDGRWRMEGGNTRLKLQAVFFYADYGMVASTKQVWLQTTFYILTGYLIGWV